MNLLYICEESAERDMYKEVDDPCINNYRFTFMDNKQGMKEYEKKISEGCCGFFDREIYILKGIRFKKAKIGCNYGH